MATTQIPKILDFLSLLRENNNREWFNEHKATYLEVKDAFEALTQTFIELLQVEDNLIQNISAKDCTFRIYKDVRFSKDKLPYKTHLGAYINQGGRKGPTCGYYLHLEPGASLIAGGLHCPPAPVLFEARDAIYADSEEFKAILNDKTFKKTFGKMVGESLKRGPKGFPKDFEDIDLLKFKSFNAIHYISDEDLLKTEFIDETMNVFRATRPLNTFFNRAILAMD